MSAPRKTNGRRVAKYFLAIVAFAAGVYFYAFSKHVHHVPWPSLIITVIVLAVAGYFVFRKKA